MKNLFVLAIISLIQGCMTQPIIPDGYIGGIAVVNDTFVRVDTNEVDIYYIKSVNDIEVTNAVDGTYQYSAGFKVRPIGHSREVPAQALKIEIAARNFYSSPMSQAFSSGRDIYLDGIVAFQPDPDINYIVRGDIRSGRPMIWLEDDKGNLSSEIIYPKENGSISYGKNVDSLKIVKNNYSSVSDRFASITGGESSNYIEAFLGKPDVITERKAKIPGQISFTRYIYNNLGEVRLVKYMRNFYVHEVVPSIPAGVEGEMKASRVLTNGTSEAIRHMAVNYYSQDDLPEGTLDLFAMKIWENRSSEDDYLIDALSWLCKVLGKSGKVRYKPLMTRLVSDDSVSGKIKRYAKSSSELMVSGDEKSIWKNDNG